MTRKRGNEERTAEYVYSLPEHMRCDGAIMDTVLTISDDGPAPMKNLRPATKHPNGADKFSSEHRQYEGEPSGRVRVDAHNAACPQLTDELNKRRSTAQVTIPEKQNNDARTSYFDPNCKYCIKLKKEEEKKKMQQKEKRIPKKHREKRSRVTKSRKPQRRRNTFCVFKTRGCQYFSQLIHKGTSPGTSLNKVKMAEKMAANGCAQRENSETCLRNDDSRSGFSNTSKKSEPSVTTYNSFMSMDHEPMVDN